MTVLEQLQAAYVPKLRAQLQELEKRLDLADSATAIRIAHKVAGSAGSYGLGEVSRLARRLEHALEDGADPAGQRAAVSQMRAAIPAVGPVEESAVVLAVTSEAIAAAGWLTVSDPVEALEHAMDRTLRAVVVPYTAGARGGRALLRSLSGLDEFAQVPVFLTCVPRSEAAAACAKAGAVMAFEGDLDETVLQRIEERLA